MVASCQPIATLVNPTFKKMIEVARSNLHIPSPGRFRSWLLAQKLRIDKRLREVIASAHALSFTIDYWEKHGRSYLGITVHCMVLEKLSGSFKMSRHFVCLVPCSNESHTTELTGALIDLHVVEALGEIPKSKVVGMTTNNGPQVKKFALESRLFRWISCFAHSLQLFVKTGTDKGGFQ